jgi:hypothetical protein
MWHFESLLHQLSSNSLDPYDGQRHGRGTYLLHYTLHIYSLGRQLCDSVYSYIKYTFQNNIIPSLILYLIIWLDTPPPCLNHIILFRTTWFHIRETQAGTNHQLPSYATIAILSGWGDFSYRCSRHSTDWLQQRLFLTAAEQTGWPGQTENPAWKAQPSSEEKQVVVEQSFLNLQLKSCRTTNYACLVLRPMRLCRPKHTLFQTEQAYMDLRERGSLTKWTPEIRSNRQYKVTSVLLLIGCFTFSWSHTPFVTYPPRSLTTVICTHSMHESKVI